LMLYCWGNRKSERWQVQFKGVVAGALGGVHWQYSGAKPAPSTSQLFLGIWRSLRL
jgi:hypothetical protein